MNTDRLVAWEHARLSARRLAESAHLAALESIVTALRLAPEEAPFWAQFADLIQYFNPNYPADPLLLDLLGRALEHPAVDPGSLVRPISRLALSRPPGELFADPLLLRMLELAVARDAELERHLVDARAEALKQVSRAPALPLRALVAIAHQCFNSEYVFAETAAEKETVEQLGRTIATAADPSPHWHAVYACYRSLGSLDNAQAIASKLAATPLAMLARHQILEPLEERRLAATIPVLTPEASAASAKVREQYESNPYPRWIRTQSIFATGSLKEIARELFPHADLAGVTPGPARILVAGCGTGQNSIATARRFLAARVLAVDLSLASLCYAKRKTLELGVDRIDYQQADILALESLSHRFDFIESSGVLHHLEDPLAGWRALASLLEPRGLMRIGLYSMTGRRHITHARKLVASGFAATAEGIRACRAAIRARPDDPQLARVARGEDFYSMSGCRDLLFHVQERNFTLPEISAALEQLGLSFLGFEFADGGATMARYRARYPADRALADLGNWHQFEQEHPDSFSRMYQFWVRARG